MTSQRMDHVGVVGGDLDAAIAFFGGLGMELEGGGGSGDVVELDGVRVDIAMGTPEGYGRLELTKFHAPTAVTAEPENAPGSTLGLHRIMFAVDDIDATVAGLRARGTELVGEMAQYQDSYPLCYARGPEGIVVALADRSAWMDREPQREESVQPSSSASGPSRPTCDQPDPTVPD